jgi:V8-like Glu-specific endopeptidase
MSGSPVFRPDSTEVIGIHNAAIASAGISTTSFAIPLVQDVVADWLTEFDESPETDELDATVSES